AGSWLRAIVRNACRAQLRARRTVPVDDLDALGLASREPDPDELVDRHALRDWVWHALERLSPSVRLVAMLRYFTGVTAYEQIAALCAVPVGTVRSRLSQARATLAQALRDSADVAHGDAAALTEARWRE